jgi:protoporphyrinogen oxidase
MARSQSKKTSTRRPRKASSATASRAKTAAPTVVESTPVAAANGSVTDLAGGLRTFLDAIETEVRAVSALSSRVDGLVKELNTVREEQAQRLLALDALRASATDGGLTSYLDKLIRPRLPRVAEVIPERLTAQ